MKPLKTISKSYSVKCWTDDDCDILNSEHIVTITVEALSDDLSIQNTQRHFKDAVLKMYQNEVVSIEEL